MRRLLTWAMAAVLPALLVSALTIGCSGDNKKDENTQESKKGPKKGGKDVKLEELASTGWTTVKGRVTLDGAKPDIEAMNKALLAAIEGNQDKKHCLADSASADEKSEQTWKFGQNNGVADVFVWLAPPEGKYFKIDWDKKPWPKEVTIDQPHCAFRKHAEVLFPGAYNPDNPDEPKPSGQKFIVKNDAPMNHNTTWKGTEGINDGDNKLIPAGDKLEVKLKADPAPVTLKCDIHKFMTGVVRVFDHPYAAVTDKDGEYEIKNVPAGAELRIVVWHEGGIYGGKNGAEGDKVTLEAGKDNEHNYTIKSSK
jgi:hypothetical protein